MAPSSLVLLPVEETPFMKSVMARCGLPASELASGLAMIPAALLAYGAFSFHATVTPELIASFIYLVLVLSVGASLIWFWLLRHGEASRVTAFYYLTPVFGLALSALFLHEPVGWHDLFGLAAIAAGISIVQRS